MAEIKNVTVKTGTRYPERDEDDYSPIGQGVLELEIPLPGGTARYEIPLGKGVRESLEFAAGLAEKGKK